MPLHSIEVENFKSYKGSQTIGPFKNFTAVIGPNGAGKSNLMDAISFVLGVRSAQLRSTQLRDLIYKSGDSDQSTASRKQPNKASVTAVYIDYKTGSEYRFCRTIIVSSDKSGASTYSINRKVVKWEDYQAALESHNILVKAKNFLVFQGDVEAIASQNPKALSKLIDQISGSLELAPEYEAKKAAYFEAAKHSNDMIVKRRVINGEIKDFKQQKTEMEKFDQLSRERDEIVVHHLLWKLYHIDSQTHNHTQSIHTKKLSLEPLRTEAAEYDKLVTVTRREYAQVTKELLKIERDLKEREKWKEEEKLPRLVECEERIKHLEKKRASEERSLASIKNEKATKEQEIARLKKELVIVSEARDKFYAHQAASNLSVSLSEKQLKEYQALKAKSSTECAKHRTIVKNKTQDVKTKMNKLSQLEDELEQIQTRYKKLDQDHDFLTNQKTMCENKIDTLSRDLTKNKKLLHDIQTERTRHAQTETELKEKLQDCLKKMSEAGASQRETESELRLRTMIERLRKVFPGVSGRLQDLCTPVARKHDVAIRIVLGRNLNAVVVDTQKTAFDCVEYLKTQRMGQASFIPLDTIQVNPVNERFRNLAKGARLAIDLIKHDPIHERAVHYACGNAIICDSTQIARHVVYDKGNEVKAVTLDGTVIHKGGNMSGGVTGLDSSRRFDEREIQGLKRTQEEILALIKENNSQIPRNTDEALLADISRLDNDLALVKDDLLNAETRLTGIVSELKVLGQQEQDLTSKVQKRRAEVETVKAELTAAQEIVNKVEDKIFGLFCQSINVKNIREYEGHQLQLQQQSSTEQERLETTVSKLQHQINFETEQLAGLNERQATIQTSTEKTLKTLESIKASKQQVEEEIVEIDGEIEKINVQHAGLTATQAEKSKAAAEAKKKSLKVTKTLDEALRDISGWNDEIERLGSDRLNIYRRCKLESISIPLLEGSLSKIPIDETIRPTTVAHDESSVQDTQQTLDPQDFGLKIDYTSLDDDEKEDDNLEFEQHLIEKLGRLNNKIEAMVPKTRAVEKLEEVEVRLRQHEQEFEGARKLAKSAKDEFTHVKNQRADLFNKAYNHISAQISDVYKELTKGASSPMGGTAYLDLEDREEPYLHGIRYHTMPPMKRFRDMEQLSGGEKTMAALALLFAIHSYQPSPFFVLDEVDSALDNLNVKKLTDYIRIKSLNDSFQFLIISLKSNLFERAVSLIGVYRDNDLNSTKTLTLDLTQYED
ncbi:hypothetical protein O181_014335 [Austropuccinia psidii MF-1]|uniref:Structural maintenance of chromosomes protein n=1 Tax=Austropuccinia psidii MF-1 TaxID=1389203 RepID=A0A9Q3C0R9_9BASI|nr:hypothetical protein [Austropuccinia psidii MF-1]